MTPLRSFAGAACWAMLAMTLAFSALTPANLA